MGMVSPQGVVYLGTVPWCQDYRHVYYDALGNAPSIISSFCNLSTEGYTYIRESSDIRVPYNADDIYGINYCVYRNNNKWFFAFVNTITYVNNNTSLLHLEEDIWQTWGASIAWHACFVAREHVNSDNIGEHLINEPAFPFEVTTTEQAFIDFSTDAVIIVMCNAIPHIKDGTSIFISQTMDNIDGSDPVSGTKYGGIYQGAKAYAFTNPSTASNFLDNLNKAGGAESIASVFLFPEDYLDYDDNTHEVLTFNSPKKSQRRYLAPKNCGGGYVPRNKKLLTFPYSYTSIAGMNGTELTIQYEKNRNATDSFTIDIEQCVPFDPSASAFVSVPDYDGSADGSTLINGEYMISCSCAPQLSWVYGAFQNWLAQNRESYQTQVHNRNLSAAFGVAGSLAGLAVAAMMAPPTGGLSLGAYGAAALGAGGSILNAAIGNNTQAAQLDAQSKVPNHVTVGSTDNNLYAINHMGFIIRSKSLMADYARSLDAFFDQFGYEVDVLKVPNRTGRPSWNYVKTVGANVGGNIPADRLQAINASLDSGVTFWHTTDVGNYSLSNGLS